ncbi:hypothetical protein ATKI12_4230 [Kitasatospora sp. Ki12]|uniref:hypothetical protein n=1 Tax=Kitasatospora xanthocidica TaxID=83382 RepID=UPI001673D576|nr:hypothetical protein [Kitasatospora xanthocidica]GHF38680.1 hypothetical protein GCM10018790_15530 [Kitasatospora xanthocidica]
MDRREQTALVGNGSEPRRDHEAAALLRGFGLGPMADPGTAVAVLCACTEGRGSGR